MSKEVHQSVLNNCVEKMSSIKELFIFLFPSDGKSLNFVGNKYELLGLPGCFGGFGDCVHIGWWSKYVTQHLHL
jgi:hypothetical protein